MRITPGENIQLAFTAVWTHRFRSALTILGIVIGITTVVTVASLLTGLRKGIFTFFQEFGPDNVFLYKTSGDPGSGGPRGFTPKEERRKPIRKEYAEIIKRTCSSVEDAGVSLFLPGFVGNAPLVARVPGFESENVRMVGVSANSFALQPRNLQAGRFFTPEEAARGPMVALLGHDLAEALYPDGRAVGRTFQVAGAEYHVLGVYEQAKGGFFGQNGLDQQITLPLRTAEMRFPQLDRYMVVFKARPGLRQQAFEEVEAMLRKIRRTPAGAENDFSLTTSDQIIRQFDSLTGLIVLVSIAISGLGLLVGGIGVMNIMLMSVTERTREIGVRKAIGARRFDIVFQFLTEAVTLTGIGGVLGIGFALLVTLLISALVPSLPSEVPAWAVIAGFGTSVMVGLFFGVWPAFKAARLDPVEALRYE